jgi:hypothetical protein
VSPACEGQSSAVSLLRPPSKPPAGALGCLDAREHLERLLIEFASRCGADGPARIPLATTEIAGLLGIDLSHACRVLRGMKEEGLIAIERGRITVPNLARFHARRAS